MARLTENEAKLLKENIRFAEHNADVLDFTKSFEEQELESSRLFTSLVNLKAYNKTLGTNNAGSRAVLGSLVQKNMLSTELDCGTYWLYINEEQFNNIKEALKEMEA